MLVAQEPELACLHEPVGEDAEEEPPDELESFKSHDLLFVPVRVVLPEEGDLDILHADDAVVGDGDPVAAVYNENRWLRPTAMKVKRWPEG